MVRRNGVLWGLALTLPLLSTVSSTAGVLSGNVATDLPAPPPGTKPSEWPIMVFANPLDSSSVAAVQVEPAEPAVVTPASWLVVSAAMLVVLSAPS